MSCSSCEERKKMREQAVLEPTFVESKHTDDISPYAGKSNSTELVHLRYYGGGSVKKGSGCASCGRANSYFVTTEELIAFVSEDSPNSLFSQTFSIGRDYFVTEKQAEYLLSLEYIGRDGKKHHKFKKIEEGDNND